MTVEANDSSSHALDTPFEAAAETDSQSNHVAVVHTHASDAQQPESATATADVEPQSKNKVSDVPADHENADLTVADLVDKRIGEDTQDMSSLKWDVTAVVSYPSIAKPYEVRKKDAEKRSLQAVAYSLLLEERLKDMERRFELLEQQVNATPPKKAADEADAAAKSKPVILEPKFMGWRRFINPTIEEVAEPVHVIEVLAEQPYALDNEIVGRPDRSSLQRHADNVQLDTGRIERIRIQSLSINAFIGSLMKGEKSPLVDDIHIKPFKVLLTFEHQFREKYKELVSDLTEANVATSTKPEDRPDTPPAKAVPEDEEKAKTIALRDHLKVLLEFLDTFMEDKLSLHRHLRSNQISSETKIQFADLWHLYAPGRIVFDPRENQAYMVMAVRGGRQYWSQTDPSIHALVPEKHDLPFHITCVSMGHDGKYTGPIQSEKSISTYDNTRLITSLPLIPVGVATFASSQLLRFQPQVVSDMTQQASSSSSKEEKPEDVKTISQYLQQRGDKFAKLATSSENGHKEYKGFTLDAVRDHVDSQVIVDLEFFYLKHPDQVSNLGISEPELADEREIKETIRARVWSKETETYDWTRIETEIFDDRGVDALLTKDFNQKHPSFSSYSNTDFGALKNDYNFLFPNSIHAFVLRTRKWSALNIDYIYDVRERTDGFADLVLPEEHKEIVEGLVQVHARGANPIGNLGDEAGSDNREDLVRGKGKGLIILLHGVPGVGKTSTAETVAEYTRRPLFALTCGDIGDNAYDVQQRLEENFSLAHRWGCVMLLDEADVFLQARSKDDMQRNAVVSVFLRVLEYYSGILFLTTNKVGAFDEAFRSRIHISLYYKELDREQTIKIWENNLRRIRETRPKLVVEEKKLIRWVKDEWKRNEEEAKQAKRPLRPWNGRQIQNACRTAAALAEFKANAKKASKGKLTTKNLETVAKTSREFDKYLQATHGKDEIARAAGQGDRGDDNFTRQQYSTFFPMPNHLGYQQQMLQQQNDAHSRTRSRSPKKRSSGKASKSSKAAVRDEDSDSNSSKASSAEDSDDSDDD